MRATGKPIVVTRPLSPEADVDEDGFLGSADWLTVDDAPNVLAILDRVQHDTSARENLRFWANHHFGDTTPGASTRRFHEAVELLLAEWARNAAVHAGDRLPPTLLVRGIARKERGDAREVVRVRVHQRAYPGKTPQLDGERGRANRVLC